MSEFINILGMYLQVIISLGTVAAFFWKTAQTYKTRARTVAQQAGAVPASVDHLPAATTGQPPNLIELAFTLVCSAIFSLLIVDALIISGRAIPGLVPSGLGTMAISIVVTLFLLQFWKQGEAITGIGLFAMITLLLTLFAPGGPIVSKYDAASNTDGIRLWVPVLTNIFLIAAAWIYKFGHPFDPHQPRFRRLLSLIVLSMAIATASFALGRQIR